MAVVVVIVVIVVLLGAAGVLAVRRRSRQDDGLRRFRRHIDALSPEARREVQNRARGRRGELGPRDSAPREPRDRDPGPD